MTVFRHSLESESRVAVHGGPVRPATKVAPMPADIPSGFGSDRPAPRASRDGAPALDDDRLARWADLLAAGRDRLPDELPPLDHDRLVLAVRTRLRQRLVRLIARAIASRIRREGSTDTEVTTHA
jgi:hypothetical protein